MKKKINFKIEKVKEEDIDECLELQRSVFKYSVRFDKSIINSHLSNVINYGYSYKAVVGKKAVGFITSFIMTTGQVFVEFLSVAKKYRNKGIGSALIERLIKESQSDLQLKTAKTNKTALHFYIEHDFVVVNSDPINVLMTRDYIKRRR